MPKARYIRTTAGGEKKHLSYTWWCHLSQWKQEHNGFVRAIEYAVHQSSPFFRPGGELVGGQ
eukprot:12899934-Prorocentrum_lima.AAC.1